MSIEFDAVYGFEVDVDDENVEDVVSELHLYQIYSGDPIPGFDGTAIGVSLNIGNDTEKQLFKKIQDAKKELTPEKISRIREKININNEPRIIMMAHGSW